jgi:hypothetical protein
MPARNERADAKADQEPPRNGRLFYRLEEAILQYPITPDGRYFVVRGRLWRCSDPHLSADTRKRLVDELMAARRAVAMSKRAGDQRALAAARSAVDAAKTALGERGAPWWHECAPDYNRRLAKNTPYAEWWTGQEASADARG